MTQTQADSPTGPVMVQIDTERAGQRIDNFLLGYLKGVPKSRIYRILRKGEVRVNKGRIKPDYRLQAGDEVRIPPVRRGEEPEPAMPSHPVLNRIASAVIYEDEGLLVLNKPAGIAVHGGSGVSYGIIEAMRVLRPEARSLELVHRLDRDTSGCLMIAKKRSVLRDLHEQLRADRVQKQYLALVRGTWSGGVRKVDAPLRKNILQSGERMVNVAPDGKTALSYFEPVKRFSAATLVAVTIKTGRTHQIRVHASHIGHPVAGDEKYGDTEFNRVMRGYGLRRLFLHAETLRFFALDGNREIAVKAPLDEDLDAVLRRLESP